MKTRIFITILFVAAQLALALLPLIPKLKEVLPLTPTPRDQLDWQIKIIGLQFTLFSAYAGLLFLLRDHDAKTAQKQLADILPQTRVEKLRDDHFYVDFLAAAKRAQHAVNIMYLAAYPPEEVPDERLDYYKAITKTIKKKSGVQFRRIVRSSARNRAWTIKLIKELREVPNAHLAILADSGEAEMPLALSAQIIDGRKVWFVSVASQEREGTFRDIFIENEAVAHLMQLYYDRIWERSTKLLTAGRLTEEGQAFCDVT